MDHIEGSDVREAIKAMTISTPDDLKMNSIEVVMKDAAMVDSETIALMKNTDSSEIMKESAMEELESNYTRNLDSSKVELAMKGKLKSDDTTWTENMLHEPFSLVLQKNGDSSQAMKESTMEEFETIATKNMDSSLVLKESAVEELVTTATRHLDSSKVVDELTMEGKVTSNDTTRRGEDMLHAPFPLVRRQKNADSSDVVKESVMEELDSIATRNLNSSKVEELAMEDKLDATWGNMIHVPWGPLKSDKFLVDGTRIQCQCIGCGFKRNRLRCQSRAKFVKTGDKIYCISHGHKIILEE